MHVYFGKHITRKLAGSRMVRVECTRCECEYFYQLSRVGTGNGMAPYYIGVARATRTAEKQAQKDLQRRLAREADLVPCPMCEWINEQLIEGYRLVRFRFLGKLTRLVLLIGAILTVVFGVLGAILDPAEIIFFLILPLGLLLFAGAVFLLQMWLRSRIRPNRNFPLPPKLPPSSPPALLKHPESGLLYPAKPASVAIAVGGWCDFQVGRHQLPSVCCGCLEPATTMHGYRAGMVIVPRCQHCALDHKRDRRRIFYAVAMVAAVLSVLALAPLNLQAEEFCSFAVIAVALSAALGWIVATHLTSPVRIATGDRSRDVIRLRFKNPDYTQVVAHHVGGS